MPPERNAPCPCGSGKKYKKCCGANESHQPDYIGINRAIAYKGAVGRARQEFCERYTEHKKSLIQAIGEKLRKDVADQGQQITCGRGCDECCKLFVVSSLQECEAIVYHLYRHEDALKHFLKSYETWKDRIFRNQRCFQRINDLHCKITAGEATDEDRKRFDAECYNYAVAGIPCPFIQDGACSIYEVRPYVCAGVVAITPAEWCYARHPRHFESAYYKLPTKSSNDLPYFGLKETGGAIASMPSLVYDLLSQGYGTLGTVPGLEKMAEEALADPEVQVILQNLEA